MCHRCKLNSRIRGVTGHLDLHPIHITHPQHRAPPSPFRSVPNHLSFYIYIAYRLQLLVFDDILKRNQKAKRLNQKSTHNYINCAAHIDVVNASILDGNIGIDFE